MTKRWPALEAAYRSSARRLAHLSRHCIAVALMLASALVAMDAAATNNSAFVSQSVPATMALGQTYQVSVTMQNVGDTTWDSGSLYRLGPQAPQDNAIWGISRAELPAPVAPGTSATFNFTVTAPPAAGIYNFQWRMVQDAVEWFGAYTENVAIKDGVNDAVFVTQNVPSIMTPGQPTDVSVTMQNSGNMAWTPEQQYRLGAQNPADNTTWGMARVELPNEVAPGETVTFNFSVATPDFDTYNFQWQMVQDDVEWFGAASTNVAVRDGANNATFTSQSVPAVMVPGQTYEVLVTMQNTGTSTWFANGIYSLGAQNPQDNMTWQVARVGLPNDVAPGESVTFDFEVTAPLLVGTYNLQWQMVQDYVGWFGDYTTNVAVRDGVNSAVFVSQVAPNVMTPGETYPVSVTMTNTGNTTWTGDNLYRLGAQNAQDNTVWGSSRVELPYDVAPGDSVTFNFNVVAPSAMGTYNFQWQMVEDTLEWFGGYTDNIAVKDGMNDAVIVFQNAPSSMFAAQDYSVSVKVKNTGTSTWTADKLYRLGSQNPQDNSTWGFPRVNLPGPVLPGASVTFNFFVAAPAVAGNYSFQWRMVEDNVEWFGGVADSAAVNVQAGVPNTGNLTITLDGITDGGTVFEGSGASLVAFAQEASSDVNVPTEQIAIDGAVVAVASRGATRLEYGWVGIELGTHVVTAAATDINGVTAAVTKTVNAIVDPLDVPIRAVLESFKTALASGDKATAMTLLSSRARGVYSSIIDTLMPRMPQIVASWSDPRRMSMDDVAAEYAVTRMNNGVLKVYIFSFVIDQNGQWVIDSM